MPVTHKKHNKSNEAKKTVGFSSNVVSDCSGAEVPAVVQASICCSTEPHVVPAPAPVDLSAPDAAPTDLSAPDAAPTDLSVPDTAPTDLSGSTPASPVVTSSGCCAASTSVVDLSGSAVPTDLSGASVTEPEDLSKTPVITSSGCCTATSDEATSVNSPTISVSIDLSGSPATSDLSGTAIVTNDLSGSTTALSVLVSTDLSGSALVTTDLSGSAIFVVAPVDAPPSSPQKSKSSGCTIM